MKGLNNEPFLYGYPIQLKKPVGDIERLIACLQPVSLALGFHKGESIKLITAMDKNQNEKKCAVILLVKGEINLWSVVTGKRLVATAQAPAIFGLMGSSFRNDTYKLIPKPGSELYCLSRDIAIDRITQQALIREVLNYYSYMSDYQSRTSNLLINRTSYEIVCALLQEINAIPYEKRIKISVINYILVRSKLARSGVAKILSDLRFGGYIEIQYGKLKGILKRFPCVY